MNSTNSTTNTPTQPNSEAITSHPQQPAPSRRNSPNRSTQQAPGNNHRVDPLSQPRTSIPSHPRTSTQPRNSHQNRSTYPLRTAGVRPRSRMEIHFINQHMEELGGERTEEPGSGQRQLKDLLTEAQLRREAETRLNRKIPPPIITRTDVSKVFLPQMEYPEMDEFERFSRRINAALRAERNDPT